MVVEVRVQYYQDFVQNLFDTMRRFYGDGPL